MLLVTVVAEFTAKTTNSEKTIYFLSRMYWSINKLTPHMLFTCKNFLLTSFKSLQLNCSDNTQVIQKCEMWTTVSKALTYHLIQSYLLKDKSITPPPLMFSYWRCFMKKAVLKNFTIFTGKLQTPNFTKRDSLTAVSNFLKLLQSSAEQLLLYLLF